MESSRELGANVSGGVTRFIDHPPPGTFVPTNLVPAENLISGTPNERGYTAFVSEDGKAESGVWACDVYKERIPWYPFDELYVIIEGTAVITVDGEQPQTFSAGDAFFVKRGTALTFEVTSPLLKHWMTYDPDASAKSQ